MTTPHGGAGSVLHVSQVSELGGLTYCVADYVRLLLERGWRVTLACPPGLLSELAGQAGADVVTWHAVRSPGPGALDEARRLASVVRRVDPQLVHLHSSKAGLAGRLALRGHRPTVFSPHGWSWDAVTGRMADAVTRWERLANRWTHSYLCVSAGERDRGRSRGLNGPWDVLPNTVDLTGEDVPDQKSARMRFGLPDDVPMTVCVGRLCEQKAQDVLLRAWPAVRRAVPEARLVLVGDGPQREQVTQAARDLGGVTLAGAAPRTDALAWMSASDVVTLPSRWEGMSVVLLEARAMGRAVVATDVTGSREVVGDSGGRLVPPDDPETLASALVDLLGDRDGCREVGEVARSGIAEDPLTAHGNRLVDVYRRLLA